MKLTSLLLIIFFLSACAVSNRQQIGEIKTFNYDSKTKFEDQFKEVLEFCQPRLQGFEAKSTHQAKLSFYMKLSGLLAGSVFAPALIAYGSTSTIAMATTAALAGWAGASPFAGEALEASGLSGAGIAETRNGIIADIKESLKRAVDGSLPIKDRRNALLEIQASCIAYEISVPHVNWNNEK